jgi:hypothetical protein
MPKITQEELARINYDEALYSQRAMPLLVACRRFIAWMEDEFTDPTEMPEWLLAKGLMIDIKDHIDSVTVNDDFAKLEHAAEQAFDDYFEVSDGFLPPIPVDEAPAAPMTEAQRLEALGIE